MDYEEKRQARKDRYLELSAKAEQGSKDAYESSNKLSQVLPFGQPILVGHHSENAHRNLIKRMSNKMDKSVELTNKAEYYKHKAEAMNNTAISSDDPDAIQKLDAKIKGLEELRTQIKAREHARYELSNLSQNIRSVKLRVEKLRRLAKVPDTKKLINGVTIHTNKEINRIQLLFPEIPSQHMRKKLKMNGFRWSPTNQAWQGYINNNTMWKAEEILRGD